jgi:hypothetical protein
MGLVIYKTLTQKQKCHNEKLTIGNVIEEIRLLNLQLQVE